MDAAVEGGNVNSSTTDSDHSSPSSQHQHGIAQGMSSSSRPSTSQYIFPAAAATSEAHHTTAGKTFRTPQRRLSHPSSPPNRVRIEQEDGEFIKRAFENLAIHSERQQYYYPPAVPSSSSLAREETTASTSSTASTLASASGTPTATTPTVTEADDNYDDDILITRYPAGSRLSVVSTSSSQPFSALSNFSGPASDRTSIYSTHPLLHSTRDTASDSPPGPSSNGRRHLRTHSHNNVQLNPAAQESRLDISSTDDPPAITQLSLAESRPTQPIAGASTWATSTTSPFHPFDASHYTSSIWSDPFAESHELPSLRLRRRSTISGYSVNSADWNSLRRGSLASLENGSPTSAAMHNNIMHPSRSRNSTHSNVNAPLGNSNSTNNAASAPCPTAASMYATLARSQQPSQSLRWEAWAAAYRESLLQHAHSGFVSSALSERFPCRTASN